MALFHYRAADSSGKVLEGIIEAEAEYGVVSRLHEMGFIPLRIAPPSEASEKTPQAPLAVLFRKRVNQKQILHFTQELSTLLGAGLPIDRSLSVLANLVEGEEFKKRVRLLLEAVRAGKSLAAAMGEHPDTFPKLYVNMIRAGESTGILESVLRHLGSYLERSLSLKEDLKSAVTYPLLLAGAAGVSLIVLFVYVIPKFSLIFRDVNQSLPWITTIVIGFSSELARYGWLVLLLLVVGATGLTFYIRNPEGRLHWDRWRLNLWLLGDLLRKLEAARFARTLAALLNGGVPLLEALGTAQSVAGNSLVARAIGRVQNQVREGKGMIGPLTESGVFPDLALHMIGVGEETGRLEGMLINVADYYDEEVKHTTKRLTALLEPVLILGMGTIIAIVVISMLLAIFSINDLPF